MDVNEAIRARRSIRSFKKQPVEREKLTALLEAARLAPSGWNHQNWHFVVVKSKAALEKLAHCCDDDPFVAEAGATIVCCSTKHDITLGNGEKPHTMDIAIATSFMMLQAVELGLGSCLVGGFNESKVKRLLRVPDSVKVVLLLAVGYPHYTPGATERKSLSEITSAEDFIQKFV